jgi:HD superfamily phosphohydrolase
MNNTDFQNIKQAIYRNHMEEFLDVLIDFGNAANAIRNSNEYKAYRNADTMEDLEDAIFALDERFKEEIYSTNTDYLNDEEFPRDLEEYYDELREIQDLTEQIKEDINEWYEIVEEFNENSEKMGGTVEDYLDACGYKTETPKIEETNWNEIRSNNTEEELERLRVWLEENNED